MAEVTATRQGPLDGLIAGSVGVAIAPAAPAHRISLRVGADGIPALNAALGLELPTVPKSSVTSSSDRMALWLGPDEWLIIDEKLDPMVDVAGTDAVFSVVDVSHRNTAIKVAGRGARATLEAGCPQNLSDTAFPAGACSRTVLGKIEVVLVRTDVNVYRIECWRSFAEYAFEFLADAAHDCMA
ncbi:MAG: sarcosine oxidase subunit gamma [Rhizobiales bacterium]|nr:sarcosine oxidase subunit gamma [Hyphomicrobiales bacterium]MBA68535.1 sarcosine oxidase subunit gamma [Hyphomicrobiales bacterium]|tara:strand:- start:513 stop:1064 length:552 start_codon:yes stop_codon:yes gene_type:complete